MIQDSDRDAALIRYNDRGILKRELRSYEVSLWTLQDEFITVLKWSDVEQKGRIEEPTMTLNIDGTQNFSFKIPMYLNKWDQASSRLKLVENPIWYNAQGNLIEGLRKVRVIFNKTSTTNPVKVFDFIIIKVTESHEGDVATCQVDCEGLAFHELGKIGYKISLSQANFELVYKEWEEGGMSTSKPIQNLQYWCKEAGLESLENATSINPRTWYYKVDMDWSSFAYSSQIERHSNVVYEEAYTSSWNENLVPQTVEKYKEKARPIEIDKSNLYNITQTIAEKFGVHCRYDYDYDENYQITKRVVVFYNNFNKEKEGLLSFTYPYSAKSVERNIDTTDLTTKMFIETVEGVNDIQDTVSIMDSEANMMKEDYILNFDYLHTIRGITDEQYEAVKTFQKDVRKINVELMPLQRRLAALERKKTEVSAKKTVAENSIDLAQEQIDYNQDLLNSLLTRDSDKTENDGFIHITASNPEIVYVIGTGKKGYIDLNNTNKGIEPGSIEVYKTWNPGQGTFDETSKVKYWKPVYDKTHDYIIRLNNVPIPQGDNENHKYYMIYKYTPKLYYEPIIRTWQIKIAEDTKNKQAYTAELTKIEGYITAAEARIDELLEAKRILLKEFERMMGPALREGYWTPEDYKNFGETRVGYKQLPNYYETAPGSANTVFTVRSSEDFIIGWDNLLFDEEVTNEYKVGITETTAYYPCINLEQLLRNKSSSFQQNFWQHINDYSFIFNTNYYDNNATKNDIKYTKMYAVGSEAILGFMRQGNGAIPVLILVGAKDLSSYVESEGDETRPVSELSFMRDPQRGHPRLAIVNASVLDNLSETSSNVDNITGLLTNIIELDEYVDDQHPGSWVPDGSASYKMIYPRIKFNTTNVKADATNLTISYMGTKLEPYTDYQITTRITEYVTNNIYEPDEQLEYYINIKPHAIVTKFKGVQKDPNSDTLTYTFFDQVGVSYVVADLATGIYVDGLEIAKKSSEPKVEYNLEANILDENMLRTLYDDLARIVMINDVQLKLEDVFGYISGMTLNLDHPENDTIEVKNYTNKFEDLFSTIVAQTTQISREGNLLSSALDGNTGLSAVGLDVTLSKYGDQLDQYLDTHFKTSSTVESVLQSIFNEAGTILGSAQGILGNAVTLSIENSNILSGFAQKVSEELAPIVTSSQTRPVNFKAGDVWIETDANGNEIARYVATTDSGNSGGSGGFTRTHDGTLASITGAALSIDAEAGALSLMASDHIYIAAGSTVDIVGNKEVNIGGTTINIGTTSINGSPVIGGVNIVATSYNDQDFINAQTSKVLIHPDKIYMAGAKITMLAGTDANNTSTATSIELDGEKGVWIGSNKTISIFSGEITNNTTSAGASVEISKDHILFGTVSANNDTTAMEITPKQIVLAAGTTNISSTNITVSTGTGVQITKSKIGLAVAGSSNTRTAILMDGAGITVGVATAGDSIKTNGTFVDISSSGITIGSSANLNIILPTFKISSNNTQSNPNLYIADKSTWASATTGIQYTANGGLAVKGAITATSLAVGDGTYMTYNSSNGLSIGSGNSKLTYKDGVLTVKGDITATTLNITGSATIGGWTVGSNSLYSGSGNKYVALNSQNSSSYAYAIWAGKEDPNDVTNSNNKITTRGAPFRVTRNGRVYMDKLMLWDSENKVYKEVDFSDFNQAVSVTGSWSGSKYSATYTATASFWGKFTQTISSSTTISVESIRINAAESSGATAGAQANISFSNGGTGGWSQAISVDCTVIYKNGWNDAAAASTSPQTITINPGGSHSVTVPIVGGGTGIVEVKARTSSGGDSGGDDGGGGTGGSCFAAGTPILMADNSFKSIDQLALGDKVLSYNQKEQTYIPSEITAIHLHKDAHDIVNMYFSSGLVLTVTSDHPFLTAEGWKAIKPKYENTLELLHEGDQIKTLNNEFITLNKIIHREDLEGITVYNCEVEIYHTYIVDHVIVHNAKDAN